MMQQQAALFVRDGLNLIQQDLAQSHSRLHHLATLVLRYPIRLLAAFLFAPFLLLAVAWRTRSGWRRTITLAGLLLSAGLSYFFGTLMATLGFTWLIASYIGWTYALGWLVGSYFVAAFTLIAQLLLFHLLNTLFLKISTPEVMAYLRGLIEDGNMPPEDHSL